MNPVEYYENYIDIIDLPHHQSTKRPHMPVEDRAAQFSPFAALTGYEDAVKETARLTNERIELDEYSKEEVNQELNKIKERLRSYTNERKLEKGQNNTLSIEVTYFVPDERKAGGAYVTVNGAVKKIKEFEQLLILTDGREIPINEIVGIVCKEEEALS